MTTNQSPAPEGTPETKREVRQWWAVHQEAVLQVTGYRCTPSNPDYWWCPQIGSSCSEKHHLFTSEKDALLALKRELTERLSATERRLKNTQNRLLEL